MTISRFHRAQKVCPSAVGAFVGLLVLAFHGKAFSAGSPAESIGIQRHTLQTSDSLLTKQIESKGGTLIFDYGTYRLYSVTNLDAAWLGHRKTELRDDFHAVHLNAMELDTRTPKAGLMRQASKGSFAGKQLHMIQFAGPVRQEWRAKILEAGVKIVSYIPANTYLVYSDQRSLAKLLSLGSTLVPTQWDAAYQAEHKIHPMVQSAVSKVQPGTVTANLFEIQLVADDVPNRQTIALIDSLKLEPVKANQRFREFLNIVVRLDASQISQIANRPDVVAILPYLEPQPLCERQDQIVAGNLTNGVPTGPGYLAWLASKGFTQAQFDSSGIIVDVADDGLDNGTTFPWHFGLFESGDRLNPSRVAYSRLVGTLNANGTVEGCDGHGTINGHIIAGYDDFANFPFADTSGFHYGLGVCPFVKLGSSVIFDPNYTSPNITELVSHAYDSGARIVCNSWGAHGSQGVYDSRAQLYDALVRDAEPTNSAYYAAGNQQMTIVFAAGNDGSGNQTIDTPATAKNIICVGASDNVQPFGGSDRSGIGDSEATNADSIASFSSRGPCADGRNKPDLMAPGTHISGGVIQFTNDYTNYPVGLADPCYNGNNVSGGPASSIYWPLSQQFYTASSGTSQAAPCVVGGCALVMQYFLNTWSNAPSPAMMKAYLMNSARYLTGAGAGDTLPSINQGMGEMNLGVAFDGTPRILHDQSTTEMFTNSGQLRAVTAMVSDTNKPLRVTLAWTDAPGGLSGYAYNNDLNLRVTVGTNTYKGNMFSGAYSVTGGTNDSINNVESVYLPAGTSGNFVVTIEAENINSPAVPNPDNLPNQDFALVIYNATATALPVAVPTGSVLESESCQPTNGAIDPGEIVTVGFGVQNIGTLPYSNLVATLLTNSSVRSTNNVFNIGLLTDASSVIEVPFTFKAGGTCGGKLDLAVALTDGINDVGTFHYYYILGQATPTVTFSQNFDAVSIPALPTNWSSTATGGQSPWTNSSANSLSSPDAAFTATSLSSGLSYLYSPVISVTSAQTKLSFNHCYDLECYPPGTNAPTAGFDGGVVELSIDGAAWKDVLAAGGSFVTGGYTASIVLRDNNALEGRQTWTGNSGGFINTTINLPSTCAGHNLKFRWVLSVDDGNYFGGTGWYVDDVMLEEVFYDCCNPLVAPTLNILTTNSATLLSFQSATDQTYTLQSATNLNNPSWTNVLFISGDGSVITVTNNPITPTRFYRLVSP